MGENRLDIEELKKIKKELLSKGKGYDFLYEDIDEFTIQDHFGIANSQIASSFESYIKAWEEMLPTLKNCLKKKEDESKK